MTAHSVIVSARRSAVVPRGGAFAALRLEDLTRPIITRCLADAGLAPQHVNELIAANALGAGGNPARLAALAAGLPPSVGGLSLDRQCTGGLDALILADALIRAGQADVVVAGGVESYSRRPLRAKTFADGRAPEAYEQPAFTPWPEKERSMADAAHLLGVRYGISREAQEEWARASHAKARAAHAATKRQIVPLQGVEHDPFTRTLSAALCRRAKPVAGDVTAATMAVAADAAAFTVVVSAQFAARHALSGVRLVAGASLGGDPDWPGIAPVAAIAEAQKRAALSTHAIARFEIMEAFAVQALACQKLAGLTGTTVNPEGGALAQGHPIGASGAILAVKLFHALKGTSDYGLAAIAAAGGLGTALALSGDASRAK